MSYFNYDEGIKTISEGYIVIKGCNNIDVLNTVLPKLKGGWRLVKTETKRRARWRFKKRYFIYMQADGQAYPNDAAAAWRDGDYFAFFALMVDYIEERRRLLKYLSL